jgi:hypothetical protein
VLPEPLHVGTLDFAAQLVRNNVQLSCRSPLELARVDKSHRRGHGRRLHRRSSPRRSRQIRKPRRSSLGAKLSAQDRVAGAIRIGRHTLFIARQSVLAGLAPSLLAMGSPRPVRATARGRASAGSDRCRIILNALRALRD